MSQISDHTLNADTVVHRFYRHGLRRRLATRLAGMLKAVVGVGLCISVVLGVDAAWPLAGGVRLVIGVGVMMAWAVAIWRLRPTRPDARQEALRNARHAERHYALKGNPLVNALWLAPQAGRNDTDLATVLARRSVAEGSRILESISLKALIDSKPLRRAGGVAAMIVMAWLMVGWWQPGLLAGGLARFVDPFGDHPPFSFTRFSLTVAPSQIHVGDDVAVRVELTGRVPDHASLVQVDRHSRVLQRWPMQPLERGRFERRLRSLDEPVSFWVQTDTGRSHRVDLVPLSRLQTTDATVEPDASSRSIEGAGGEMDLAIADDAYASRHAAIQIDELTNAAKRLQEYANELLGRVGLLDQEDPQALSWAWTRLEHLNHRLEQFGDRSRVLAESMRSRGQVDDATDARIDQSLAESLRRLADQLERMELLRAKAYPVGGDGRGAGAGGQGAMSLEPGDLTAWLGRLGSAAGHDWIQLNRGQALLRQVLTQARGAVNTGRSTSVPEEPLLARQGRYDETVSGGSTAAVQTDAVMQSVPGTYRHLVKLYFERLLQDQQER